MACSDGAMRIGHDFLATAPGDRNVPHDMASMDASPVHRPPPAAIVSALVRAGVSLGTAMAMERWKAQEVLDLLGTAASPSARGGGDEGASRPA
jgi:hypothetical protein